MRPLSAQPRRPSRLPLTVAALVLWSCSSGTTNQDAGSTVATPDANRSTVSVAPQSNIPADGASRVVITVTLRDANGTPIPNEEGGKLLIQVKTELVAQVTARLLADLPALDLTVEDPPIEDVIERAFQE